MKRQTKADLSLLGITIVWGASFTLMKEGIKDIPPYTFLAIRYFLGSLVLILFFRNRIRNLNLETLKYGFLIGLALACGSIFQILGLQYTTASKSGFITGLAVIFVPVIMAVLYKKLPGFKAAAGILASLLGLGLLTLNNNTGINGGDILTLFSSVFFAFQIIFVDKYGAKFDSLALTVTEMVVVALFSGILGIFFEGFKVVVTPTSVFSILFTAIFCSALAYWVQMEMQKYTTASHAAVIFLGEPVFSIIIAALFLGEAMTVKMALGAMLILLGMIAVEFSSQ
ncbi:DMT family transporter [Fonticella tunisiensis]|uniref:Threonine/homoserine efflux transporter RhtA n=1 Tax=Fonticella tunisiensis TaxID=1096341 RepID=A0A4R7KQ86_9CLOT|nr:DMT family transporter [Fonticella tunisiensis]TDT58435.1 threonine/homoserine efflux transporter RhtA [Fonticella tunisiensis]